MSRRQSLCTPLSSPFALLPNLTSLLQDWASDDLEAHDIELTSPAAIPATNENSFTEVECCSDCQCCCHRPSRDVQLVPKSLRPWLGQLNVPRTLLAALSSSLIPCDNSQCARGRRQVQNVRYTAPGWFAHVEATIRFQAFPIHFCIQTPRVVPSLKFLMDISFDEFKVRLSNRELTLYDVESSGRFVLHVSL